MTRAKFAPHLPVVLEVSIRLKSDEDRALYEAIAQGLKDDIATAGAGQWLGSDFAAAADVPCMIHSVDTTPESSGLALLVAVAVLSRHGAALRATVRRFHHHDDGTIEESVVLNQEITE